MSYAGERYMSALAEDRPASEPREEVRGDRVVALVHDLARSPLPEEFDRCDLIYAEPPWSRDHLARFFERAGATGSEREWPLVLEALAQIAATARRGRQVIFASGAEVERAIPPLESRPIRLEGPGKRRQGVKARLLIYGPDEVPEAERTTELLQKLARHYEVVGDPCCGYGNTGKVFVRAGGRAVLSDVNPYCIGYIADTMHTWPFGLA